jgi:hypothetical protein
VQTFSTSTKMSTKTLVPAKKKSKILVESEERCKDAISDYKGNPTYNTRDTMETAAMVVGMQSKREGIPVSEEVAQIIHLAKCRMVVAHSAPHYTYSGSEFDNYLLSSDSMLNGAKVVVFAAIVVAVLWVLW